MDIPTLHAFEDELRKHAPNLRIAYKDETPWMKLMGFLATPFNRGFMSKFTTTIGKTIYFPSKSYYEVAPKASFVVLAHEYVHMCDADANPIWFPLSYMMPQLLSPLALLAYVCVATRGIWPLLILVGGAVLGCFAAKKSVGFFWIVALAALAAASTFAILCTGWLSVLFFLGVALLAPLPSPGREHWEMRGYTMNLAIMAWTYGAPPEVIRSYISKYFTGSDYYFMSWSSVDDQINDAIMRAQSGALQGDPPYGVVYTFLLNNNLLRK